MCLWTQREQFWQLRRKTFNDRRIFFHSMSGKKQIFNIKMFCLKKFLWTRSKHFWRHSWETQNKRLEFFHTKKTQETSPDGRLLLRGFRWTLRLQIRQPCHETFARRPKILLVVRKSWKKRRFLNIFFLIMFLWPRIMRFWRYCKNVFFKNLKKFSQVRNWLES